MSRVQFEEFTARVDEISTDLSYVGLAVPGAIEGSAVWQLRKVVKSGTITKVLMAEGSKDFAFRWSDRLLYNYT